LPLLSQEITPVVIIDQIDSRCNSRFLKNLSQPLIGFGNGGPGMMDIATVKKTGSVIDIGDFKLF
jgi:hypothetical protein